MRETLPSEQELSISNCSVAIVGKAQDVVIYEDEKVEPFLTRIEETKAAVAADVPMQQDQEVGQV